MVLISRIQMVLAARITKYLKMPIMPHSSWRDVAELLFHQKNEGLVSTSSQKGKLISTPF